MLGAAALGTLVYSGYLGGKMVYQKGAGVQPAGGVREEETPFLKLGEAGRVLRTLGRHLKEGVMRTLEELRPERPFNADELVEGMKEELRAEEWREEGGALGL